MQTVRKARGVSRSPASAHRFARIIGTAALRTSTAVPSVHWEVTFRCAWSAVAGPHAPKERAAPTGTAPASRPVRIIRTAMPRTCSASMGSVMHASPAPATTNAYSSGAVSRGIAILESPHHRASTWTTDLCNEDGTHRLRLRLREPAGKLPVEMTRTSEPDRPHADQGRAQSRKREPNTAPMRRRSRSGAATVDALSCVPGSR
jgi:hypothetical protein